MQNRTQIPIGILLKERYVCEKTASKFTRTPVLKNLILTENHKENWGRLGCNIQGSGYNERYCSCCQTSPFDCYSERRTDIHHEQNKSARALETSKNSNLH